MKNIYTTLIMSLVILFSFNAQATTHIVTVQDFSFTPAALEVGVGDIITWNWVSGSHTTTSITVPAGTATWNNAINSGSTTFSYTVTVAGTYNYDCSIHSSLMSGSFTATGNVGISPVISSSSFLLNGTLVSNNLQITYKLEKSSAVDVILYDVSGRQLEKFNSASHNPGTYTERYSVGTLSKGEYVLELRSKDMIASRKIVIE